MRVTRLRPTTRRVFGSVLQRRLNSSTFDMAQINIHSKLQMNSSHEIPILGYGVSDVLSIQNSGSSVLEV